MAENAILLEVAFDGTDYYGWQIQPDKPTVQNVVQTTLNKLYANQYFKLQGSSRTDAGVHAMGMAASFLPPNKPSISIKQLKIALNSLLPKDIRIIEATKVDPEFNARFFAKAKAYTYLINTGEQLPFSNNYAWHQHHCSNIDAMNEAAKFLIGTNDFSSFTVQRSQIDSAVRTIFDIRFQQFGRYLCITYIGDGFLYKMIRCLTGALVAVGTNRMTPKQLKQLLDAKDRGKGQVTAPPNGLFLMKVFFEDNDWKNFTLSAPPFTF